jgi:predicted nucleotidyltransferase
MIDLIEKHQLQIAALCRKYGVKRLELFGSAARGDFNSTKSDVDFFYEFASVETAGIANRFFALQHDLETLLGVKVDLASAPDATNPYFLQVANRHRLTLYAA